MLRFQTTKIPTLFAKVSLLQIAQHKAHGVTSKMLDSHFLPGPRQMSGNEREEQITGPSIITFHMLPRGSYSTVFLPFNLSPSHPPLWSREGTSRGPRTALAVTTQPRSGIPVVFLHRNLVSIRHQVLLLCHSVALSAYLFFPTKKKSDKQ